jgi:hypothetical protein
MRVFFAASLLCAATIIGCNEESTGPMPQVLDPSSVNPAMAVAGGELWACHHVPFDKNPPNPEENPPNDTTYDCCYFGLPPGSVKGGNKPIAPGNNWEGSDLGAAVLAQMCFGHLTEGGVAAKQNGNDCTLTDAQGPLTVTLPAGTPCSADSICGKPKPGPKDPVKCGKTVEWGGRGPVQLASLFAPAPSAPMCRKEA